MPNTWWELQAAERLLLTNEQKQFFEVSSYMVSSFPPFTLLSGHTNVKHLQNNVAAWSLGFMSSCKVEALVSATSSYQANGTFSRSDNLFYTWLALVRLTFLASLTLYIG